MKKVLFIIPFFLLNLSIFSQKIITSPKFSATTSNFVKITRIELQDTLTKIDFEVDYFPNWGIIINSKETYIQNSNGGEKLYVKGAEGIKLNEMHKTPENGKNVYSLYFPPIDQSVGSIDYLEESWKIFDIELIPKISYSLIPETLRGNWLRTDGSNEWVYGFFENTIIYKGEIWDKILITNKGKNYQISLQKDGKQEILNISIKKDKLLISNNAAEPELFSKTKTFNPDYKLPGDEEYTLPILKSGTAIYKGYIKGYHPKMGTTGMVHVNDIIAHEQNSHLITINPDGSFYSEIPMIHPEEVYVRIGYIVESVYLEPGKSVFHYIDLEEYTTRYKSNVLQIARERKSLFMDESARINTDLMYMDSIRYYNYNYIQKSILDMSPDKYKEYCMSKMNKELAALSAYESGNVVSKKALQIKKMEIPYRMYENILSYNMNRESAYRTINKVPREQREIPLEREEKEPSFYNFINPDDLNNPISLVSGGAYNSLINRIRFSESVRPKSNYYYETLLDSIVELTDNERQLLQQLKDCKATDCRTQLQENNETWNQFRVKHQKFISSMNHQDIYLNIQIKNLKKYFGIEDGFASDIMFAQSKCEMMKSSQKPLAEGDKENVKKRISDTFIADYVILQSDLKEKEIAEKLEANKTKSGYVINETPKTEGDKLFETILSKYKGKVVYVDFWATWCGPCRSGMENIKPLKAEMEGKDIAFVYITNQTSPLETWNTMIPDIKGEHYRLETDQWNLLASRFNISGIPHYLLVDKNGIVVNDNIYFTSSNFLLKKMFEEYLGR